MRILDVHSFLAHRLTGRFATSWGCADPTGLFNMERNSWNAPLIRALGLRDDQFPEPLATASLVGEISAEATARTEIFKARPFSFYVTIG